MTVRQRVLVLDGEQRSALAVARSLVHAGYDVSVVAHRQWPLAGAVRGVTRHKVHADPLRAPRTYASEIGALAERLGVALAIPATDASAGALLEHRDPLRRLAALPFASAAVYDAASDKVAVHRLAEKLRIGIEDSVVVEHRGGELPDDPRLYPGVIKPHRSVVGDAVRRRTSVQFVENRDDCVTKLAALEPAAFPVLIQRRIHGPGEGIFVARWHGRTIARFAHRRLRERPPAGGVSVYRESIAAEPAVLAACEGLLDALNWNGVAMIEGKRDAATGRWYVMEINGRCWGPLQLAIDAGVDFPALVARVVLSAELPSAPTWRPGVRLRWEWGDVGHLLLRMVRSRSSLSLPTDAPGRLATLLQRCAVVPGRDRLEVFRFRDPLPFVVETLERLGLSR